MKARRHSVFAIVAETVEIRRHSVFALPNMVVVRQRNDGKETAIEVNSYYGLT